MSDKEREREREKERERERDRERGREVERGCARRRLFEKASVYRFLCSHQTSPTPLSSAE